MTRVHLDSVASSKLEHLSGEVELCDENGRVLGFFVPRRAAESELYAWARAEFTDEELEEARKETGGLSLGQVLDGLSDT